MDDLSRVDIFKSSEKLIKEKFIVLFSERLLAFDDLSEIGVHHFGDNISK